MDWDKLRIFHSVAEAGSLTHAGEALRALTQRKARLSVASPAPLDRITVALGVTGLLKFVTPRLFSAGMFERDVHLPELFGFAMRVSGIVPHRTVAVVDSVAGAEAARAAGASAFGFTADPAPSVFPNDNLLPYLCIRVMVGTEAVWLDPMVRFAPFGELP